MQHPSRLCTPHLSQNQPLTSLPLLRGQREGNGYNRMAEIHPELLVKSGPKFACWRIRPASAQIWPMSAKVRPTFAQPGPRTWPDVGKIRPAFREDARPRSGTIDQQSVCTAWAHRGGRQGGRPRAARSPERESRGASLQNGRTGIGFGRIVALHRYRTRTALVLQWFYTGNGGTALALYWHCAGTVMLLHRYRTATVVGLHESCAGITLAMHR